MKFKLILFTLLISSITGYNASAQCPGALIDSTCATSLPAEGGICKDTLQMGMANHYYDDDVTFFLPNTISVTSPVSTTVTLKKVVISGMSGMPTGLNWECEGLSAALCQYEPQPRGENYGAIKICGTPLVPGLYDITVYINVTVDAGAFGTVTQAEDYATFIEILPDSNGGVATFNYTPALNYICDSGSVSFEATYDGAPNPTEYSWDFGNGNTSTNITPPVQNYDTAGTYQVALQTTVLNYVVTDFVVLTTNNNWYSDIEEVTALQRPDLYFKFPSIGYTSSSGSNSRTETWGGLYVTIPPGISSIDFEIWDEDNGPPFGSADDLVGNGTLSLVGGTSSWLGGGASGSIAMITVPGDVLTDTLEITVVPSPSVPEVIVTKEEMCFGDSAVLEINGYAGHLIQWYRNGAVLPGFTDSTYVAYNGGRYHAHVIDLISGCEAESDSTALVVHQSPPSNVKIINFGPGKIANSNFPGTGYTIQWYKNGVAISGANDQVLDHDGDGTYTAVVFNTSFPDCSSESRIYTITDIQSIKEEIGNLSIYPNPSNGEVSIDISLMNSSKEVKLSVTNTIGKVVYSNIYSNQGISVNQTVDLSDLSSGIYMLSVETEMGILTEKLIIR